MEAYLYPSQQPFDHIGDVFVSSSKDEILSFEEAFDAESLRQFYQQQDPQQMSLKKASCWSSCFTTSLCDEFTFEELMSPSIQDDRETQASPFSQYVPRYSQVTSPTDFQATSLTDSIFSPENGSILPQRVVSEGQQRPQRKIFEIQGRRSLDDMQLRPSFNNSLESTKMVGMNGNLNFDMPESNITTRAVGQPMKRPAKISVHFNEHLEISEDCRLEKLIRSKKVFKIQRDPKPKVSSKTKMITNKPKSKTLIIPNSQPIQSETRPSKEELLNQDLPLPSREEIFRNGNSSILSFLNIMKERGYTPQQVMHQMQNLMVPHTGSQVSATQQRSSVL